MAVDICCAASGRALQAESAASEIYRVKIYLWKTLQYRSKWIHERRFAVMSSLQPLSSNSNFSQNLIQLIILIIVDDFYLLVHYVDEQMQHNQNQFVDQYLQFLTLTNLTCCVNVNWKLYASQFFDYGFIPFLVNDTSPP